MLMVVTAPTLENHLAIAVTQPVVKKVSVKDPPSKIKKFPISKVRKVLRWAGSAGSVFVAGYMFFRFGGQGYKAVGQALIDCVTTNALIYFFSEYEPNCVYRVFFLRAR